MEESNDIRSLRSAVGCNILHGHENLVDARYVLLHLGYVVLQHSHLDTLCASESLHDCAVFVPDVLLDHSLEGLNLIDTVVETDDLCDELGALWHDRGVDGTVDEIKACAEGLVHCSYAVKLRVVRTHDSAVVANQLVTRIAEVAKLLVVEEAQVLQDWIHLEGLGMRVPTV